MASKLTNRKWWFPCLFLFFRTQKRLGNGSSSNVTDLIVPRLPGGTGEPGKGSGLVARWGPLPSTPVSDWVTVEPRRSLLHKSEWLTENVATSESWLQLQPWSRYNCFWIRPYKETWSWTTYQRSIDHWLICFKWRQLVYGFVSEWSS